MTTCLKLRFDKPLNPKYWGDEEVINNKKKTTVNIKKEADESTILIPNVEDWSLVKSKKTTVVHMKKENEYTGTVANWFNKKGYGFIKSKNKTKPIFCHQKHIKKDGFRYLEKGAFVKFQIKKISKGYEAVNVQEL